MNTNIIWAAYSPLIGGFPIGTETILGKPPEYCFNKPGFWANDSLYMNWLNVTNGLNVPYYLDTESNKNVFKYVDIVVATCVCSGLTSLNTSKSKDINGSDAKQNDHMLNSAKFILETINPKVFVGENAPTLFTNKGRGVADKLKDIALEFGYSFSLYKTSTEFHGIPQSRHRTFYFMWKSDTVPELEWFRLPRDSLTDFLTKIPKDSIHYNDIINYNISDEPRYRFIKTLVLDARAAIDGTAQKWLDTNGKHDEYIEWVKTNGTDKDLSRALHTKMKYSIGKGIWDGSAHCPYETINAVIGRNLADSIHPVEDRSLNVREALSLMGMPLNFDILDIKRNTHKLTQSVPTCTAVSMVEQCVKFINGELKMTNYKVLKQNNENFTIEDFETGKILHRGNSVIKSDNSTALEEFHE